MKFLIEIKGEYSTLVKDFIQDVYRHDIYWCEMSTDGYSSVYFQRLHSQGELVSIIDIDEVVDSIQNNDNLIV